MLWFNSCSVCLIYYRIVGIDQFGNVYDNKIPRIASLVKSVCFIQLAAQIRSTATASPLGQIIQQQPHQLVVGSGAQVIQQPQKQQIGHTAQAKSVQV